MKTQSLVGFTRLLENGSGDEGLFSGTDLGDKAAPIGGAQDGASQVTDLGDGDRIETLVTDRAEQTLVTIEKTQDLKPAGGGCGDHAVQNRV